MLKFGLQYKPLTTLEPSISFPLHIRNRTTKAFYHKEQAQQEVPLLRMMFFFEILSQGEPEKFSFGTRNALIFLLSLYMVSSLIFPLLIPQGGAKLCNPSLQLRALTQMGITHLTIKSSCGKGLV